MPLIKYLPIHLHWTFHRVSWTINTKRLTYPIAISCYFVYSDTYTSCYWYSSKTACYYHQTMPAKPLLWKKEFPASKQYARQIIFGPSDSICFCITGCWMVFFAFSSCWSDQFFEWTRKGWNTISPRLCIFPSLHLTLYNRKSDCWWTTVDQHQWGQRKALSRF